MSAEPVRHSAPTEADPTVHDLPPLKYGGDLIAVRVVIRRADDGAWRGRMVFGPGDDVDDGFATAEILYGASESDLWQSVRDLREYHLRDLYRSLAE